MLIIDGDICLRCAGCIGVCPEMALFQNLDGLGAMHERCTHCGICIRFCPVQALTIEGGQGEYDGGGS